MTLPQFKFEKLAVWHQSLDVIDACYRLAELLPRSEDFNLKSQMRRAATSIALNIAEGSTSQSNAEQARFVGMAIRSLVEVVACLRIIARRGWEIAPDALSGADAQAQTLFARLTAFRRALTANPAGVAEEGVEYDAEGIS